MERYVDEKGTLYEVRRTMSGEWAGKWRIFDCLKGKKRWKPVEARRVLDDMQGNIAYLWSEDKKKIDGTLRDLAQRRGWVKVDD